MLSADQTPAYASRAGLSAAGLRAAIVRAARGRTTTVVISRGAIAASGLFTVLLTSRLLTPDARGVFAAVQASVQSPGHARGTRESDLGMRERAEQIAEHTSLQRVDVQADV